MTEQTKRCCSCKTHKPLSEFTRDRSKPSGYASFCLECNRWYATRTISLDANRATLYGKSLHDILPARTRQADATYERVYYALGKWMQDGTISDREAEALYLHGVELQTWSETGRVVGESHSNVKRAYDRAVRKLQERYADVEQAG